MERTSEMAKVQRHSPAFYSLRLSLVIVCIQRANAPPLNDALKCEIPEFDTAYFAGDPKPAWVKMNERLIFRCKEQYYDRPTYSTCAGENLWETPFPPCELVRCTDPKVISNGTATTVRDPGMGDIMTIGCNEGYWFTGSHKRICQRTGKWDGNEGQCKKIECDSLDVQNGILSQRPPYYSNTFVKVACNKGFVPTNPSGIKCQRNRTWSGYIGECIEISKIRCKFISMDHVKTPESETHPYGSSITIECEEGFAYNGTTYRTCTANSTWSSTDGSCNRILCEKPSFKILKGNFDACDPCPYGIQLNVTCEEGYTFKNKLVPICSGNGPYGKWEYVDEDCEVVACGINPVIENGIIEGNNSGKFKDERAVKCVSGFYHQGPGKVICQHDGNWSYPGNCNWNLNVYILVIVMLFILLAIGLVLLCIYIRWKNNGTRILKSLISKEGHSVDHSIDERINLDTHFIPLRIVENKKFHPDEVGMMDKYLSYLERYDKHQDVDMDNLIEGLEGGGVMVIQGRAGVGKTTLVQKLARKWAKNMWSQKYGAVFIYSMRYISSKDKRTMTLAKFLEDYMLYRPGNVSPIISKGIKAEGKGWIIIMDAIDEFPNILERLKRTHKTDDSFDAYCTELLAYKWCMLLWTTMALPKAVIILTSRHIKELNILNPKKRIEVLGLTPDAIMSMVDTQIEDKTKAEELKNVLNNNPIFMSASSITFFCQMLCKAFKKNSHLPQGTEGLKTHTKMIIFLIQSLITRNQKDDCEETPLNKAEILKLQPFTKLAYMGLIENGDSIDLAQLMFEDVDIRKAGITDTESSFAQELGLIVCSDVRLPFIQGKGSHIIEFLHLSIQELLAMAYLINQEPSTAVDVFNSMWNTKRFHMAQLYLFGLCFDDKIGTDLFLTKPHQPITEETKHRLSTALSENAKKDKNDKHQVLRAIQFAYETGNAEVTKDVAMALFGENKFAICDMQLTAVDLLAIIAMIESHGEITDIRFERVSTDESSLLLLSTFLSENNTIDTLSIIGVSLTRKSFNSLMDAVKQKSSLKHLFLENANIDDTMTSKLKEVLETNNFLEQLSIAHNEITDAGIYTIAEALFGNNSLQELVIDTGRMNAKYIGALSCLTHNNKRIKISVRGTGLGPELSNFANGIPRMNFITNEPIYKTVQGAFSGGDSSAKR